MWRMNAEEREARNEIAVILPFSAIAVSTHPDNSL
jgi:hypothetical protein